MSADGQIAQPPSRSRVVLLTLSALLAALLILFGAVLPAEYHLDPLGLGKLTGIDALWRPEEVAPTSAPPRVAAARSYPTPFRSDVVEIPLKAGGDRARGEELEYKVRVKEGGALVYSWTVPGITDPQDFYSDFHGHTLAAGNAMVVAQYRKASGASDNGVLVAPFEGIHGWFFQNSSPAPVRVVLRLSGFYELIAPGQPGNETGISANAADAR